MFILRSIVQEDLNDLFELSGNVIFINLPHDQKIISEKINRSLKSFQHASSDFSKNYYMFALEDLASSKVIGVSIIHAQHGTESEPHFYLKVSNEHKYSQTINTGFVHGTLKLGLETDGPTEIGGLVVDPSYRGNPEKLGKQISFVRFLYMAMHKDRFKPVIHSELMPPLDEHGNSALWEAIGRRFMNMNYNEADKLSRSNKEFILSLFPSDNIYMTLLPYEARNAVGKVGNDTLPVKTMLEKIGFKYINEVDPFDGGPHYRAQLNEITLIKKFFQKPLMIDENFNFKDDATEYLVSFPHGTFPFFAVKTKVHFHENRVVLPNEIIQKFHLKQDCTICAIPFD